MSALTLPHPDEFADTLTRHYHSEFMHTFYGLSHCKDSWARVYIAIGRTAEKTGSAPEAIARALVECGLRAPREFFPEKFVEALEKALKEPGGHRTRLSSAQKELLKSWKVFGFSSRSGWPAITLAARNYLASSAG